MKVGILGAGKIAATMAETIRKMEESGDTRAELYAVASRDGERAREFAKRHGAKKACLSYAEMLEDPELDLVYIATPHSHHYRHIRLCIDYGKHVLCEKAFTANARQAQDALARANAKGILAAEAIWTRYQPARKIISGELASGIIGEPRMLSASLCYPIMHKERITSPDLAGGALLDVGVYALNFAEMAFGRADKVSGSCIRQGGVDISDSITLEWRDGRMAVLNASANAISDRSGVIYGSEGFIAVENINNPARISVFGGDYSLIKEIAVPPQLTGYEYEVQEAADCIAAGKTECPSMPHAETIHMMEVMDHLRAQFGVAYPDEVESLDLN